MVGSWRRLREGTHGQSTRAPWSRPRHGRSKVAAIVAAAARASALGSAQAARGADARDRVWPAASTIRAVARGGAGEAAPPSPPLGVGPRRRSAQRCVVHRSLVPHPRRGALRPADRDSVVQSWRPGRSERSSSATACPRRSARTTGRRLPARRFVVSVGWLKAGIALERIDPGQPQQNGRHERMHKTLKAETAKQGAAHRFRKDFNGPRRPAAAGNSSLAEALTAMTHAVRQVRTTSMGAGTWCSSSSASPPGHWIVRLRRHRPRHHRPQDQETSPLPGGPAGPPGSKTNHKHCYPCNRSIVLPIHPVAQFGSLWSDKVG